MDNDQMLADEMLRRIHSGTDPEDVRLGLYTEAIGWAQDAGAVYVGEYAAETTRRIWALVEAQS